MYLLIDRFLLNLPITYLFVCLFVTRSAHLTSHLSAH